MRLILFEPTKIACIFYKYFWLAKSAST